MIIKQLINKEEAWDDFQEFCQKSKPFKVFCSGSRITRERSIKKYFDNFWQDCSVYVARLNNENILYIFNKECDNFNLIEFIFSTKPRNIKKTFEAAYSIMDFIRSNNNKYFSSVIRRTFKSDSYKKWVDRYDKRAIIFNDKDETVLWYNTEKMKKQLKVIGTNDSSKHLQDKIVDYDIINVESGINACVTQISIDEQKYLFDGKRVSLREGKCLIDGMISDDKTFVANITLEFTP